MDLKIINRIELKKTYLNFLIICLFIICGSLILYISGFQLFKDSQWVINLKDILLFGMIGIAILFTSYGTIQRKKIRVIAAFDDKIKFYETFYRNRLWWHVLSCFVSAFLLLLTHRIIFLYFGLFDLLMMLVAYPSQTVLKKELNEEELIFN